MTVTIDTDVVTVAGLTPGGEVVLFGRTFQRVGGTPRLGRHLSIGQDDDGDGVARIALAAIPKYSVWIAIDYESGAFASGSPAGFTPVVMTVPQSRPWRAGSVDVELGRGYLDFLLVRPGKGAWALDIYEGSARDEDGVIDAKLRLRVASMKAVAGKDGAPSHATKKDVLAIIDPRKLELVVVVAAD